jgi:hypothetical protein
MLPTPIQKLNVSLAVNDDPVHKLVLVGKDGEMMQFWREFKAQRKTINNKKGASN